MEGPTSTEFSSPIKPPSVRVCHAYPSLHTLWCKYSIRGFSSRRHDAVSLVADHSGRLPCAPDARVLHSLSPAGRPCVSCHMQPTRLVWKIDGAGSDLQQRTQAHVHGLVRRRREPIPTARGVPHLSAKCSRRKLSCAAAQSDLT